MPSNSGMSPIAKDKDEDEAVPSLLPCPRGFACLCPSMSFFWSSAQQQIEKRERERKKDVKSCCGFKLIKETPNTFPLEILILRISL
jgi:hypothetical protein